MIAPHTRDEHAAVVAEAARVLDHEYPGWDRRIDLTRLDLFVCAQCVLGQIGASTDDAWRETNARIQALMTGTDFDPVGVFASNSDFLDLWKEEIRRRQERQR